MGSHQAERVRRNRPKNGKSMRFEVARLASFKAFPLSSGMLPSPLAHKGFFYKGEEDLVECYACSFKLSDLQGNEDLESKHLQGSPNCPLVVKSLDTVAGEVSFGPPVQSSLRRRGGDVPEHATSRESNVEEDAGPVSVPQTQVDSMATSSFPHGGTGIGAPTLYNPLSSNPTRDLYNGMAAFTTARQSRIRPPSNSFIYSMPEADRRREMKREKMRLKTYTEWPSDAAVSKELVARAGFYHIGPGDRVRCAFCYNVLRLWDEGDIPEVEHAKYFKNCPIVKNTEGCGNIRLLDDMEPEWTPPNPTRTDSANNDVHSTYSSSSAAKHSAKNSAAKDCRKLGIVTERAHTPRFASEAARLSTFASWPRTAAIEVAPLVEAGFHYTGSEDNTRCFYCDVSLRLWKADDDVWVEHARWQPNCGYVRMQKGQKFMDDVKKRFAKVQAVVSATTTQPNLMTDPIIDRRELYIGMNSEPAKQAMDIGYTKQAISAVIERRIIARDELFTNLNELLDALNAAPPPPTQTPNSTPPGNQTPSEKEKSATSTLLADDETEEKKDPAILVEENKELKAAQTCKVCRKADVAIVFLPCGHLVCCQPCASTVQYCLVAGCNKYIMGTVKSYRS